MATFTARAVTRSDRFFYVGMSVLAIVIVFAGFAPTFYLNSYYAQRPLSVLVAIHGTAFTAWILLLLVQSSLVAAGRTDVHRRVGWAGAGLAALMIALGVATAIVAAERRVGTPRELHELQFLTIPLGDMLVFGILVGCGIYFRNRSQIHKRLMLLAIIEILDAAVARLPIAVVRTYHEPAFFAIIDLLLVFCILYDTVTHRRLHSAYLWGGLLIVAMEPVRVFLGRTDAWVSVARWIVH